jgi:hypothetical protein
MGWRSSGRTNRRRLGNHAIKLGPATIDFRDNPGNRLAMSRNHNGLVALYRVEQTRQMRLGVGCLDFAQIVPLLTGQFDWSIPDYV